jgi:hypothetical protein
MKLSTHQLKKELLMPLSGHGERDRDSHKLDSEQGESSYRVVNIVGDTLTKRLATCLLNSLLSQGGFSVNSAKS